MEISDELGLAYPDRVYRRRVKADWQEAMRAPVGRAVQRQFRVHCKDGSDKEILFRGLRLASRQVIILCEDVTEQRRLEAQLLQAQKMEAVGTLAGGIAHDFNNLLMGILGRAALAKSRLAPHDPSAEHLDGIEQHVERAAALTKQLLGFAREGTYEVRPTDLNELVQTASDLFGRTKKEVRLYLRLAPVPLPVAVDRGQIEQVLLNIFVNAWQAMPDGGEIHLSTRNARRQTDGGASHAPGDGVRYAEILIADTGPGIPEKIRSRIFDPFFTTKEKDRGTGLGLASAYGIIQNHKGYIAVESPPGQGAVFTVGLPMTEAALETSPAPAIPATHGQGCVLLVDDEAVILDVGRQMLEHLGYTVIAVADGSDALAALEAHGEKIRLVILDLVMPGMSGPETFQRLRALWPSLPVLVASGYSQDTEAAQILRQGAGGFLQKPFNLEALSEAVRRVIQTR